MEFLARFESRRLISQRTKIVLMGPQQKIWKWLHTKQADQEDRNQHQRKEGYGVEDSAQSLPALALRVIKDLSVH
jgi:hypothetical protein